MNRVRSLLVALGFAVAVSACTSEPGGGGVDIGADTSPPQQAAATTTMLPTTTTVRATTTVPSAVTTAPTFRIRGLVSDDTGAPVARATVAMGDLTTTTGPDGWFFLETKTPSVLSVQKPGWVGAEVEYDESITVYRVSITQLTIRGVRVSGEAAGHDPRFESLLQLARDTAINTFVFDTKQEGGAVLYETEVRDAHVIGAVSAQYEPSQRIEQARNEGLYTITRIAAFEDGYRAAAFPEERLAGAWLDPQSDGARGYVLALAAEACELGFDEIQFDYIRYPSGAAATRTGQLEMSQEERVAAIASFLSEARDLLRPLGCAVSADIFGIVVSSPSDQGIGQRPEELSAQVDVLSPMFYPSHYSDGWLGFDDPNDHPYDVTSDAIAAALPRLSDNSRLRPWLQAFWWTNEQIRRSIQAAEDHGVGWILWNVRSRFDASAIPTDAEVGS